MAKYASVLFKSLLASLVPVLLNEGEVGRLSGGGGKIYPAGKKYKNIKKLYHNYSASREQVPDKHLLVLAASLFKFK